MIRSGGEEECKSSDSDVQSVCRFHVKFTAMQPCTFVQCMDIGSRKKKASRLFLNSLSVICAAYA